MRAAGVKTKHEVVELGLRTLLRLRERKNLRRYRGKWNWQGDREAMSSYKRFRFNRLDRLLP